jgi:hypothetical protein
VLSVPKRLRNFLRHEPEAISAVLHILLRVIEARLRQRSRSARGRLGAVSFVQRFGSTLNAHVHVWTLPYCQALPCALVRQGRRLQP